MKIQSTRYLHRIVQRILPVLIVLFLCRPCFGADETIYIYFHSSEANINNFKSLKMEFDRYLHQFGPYELQPVKKRAEFEKQIRNNTNCLFLISSWHYTMLHSQLPVKPVLVGFRNGKNTQKRLLIAKKDCCGLSLPSITIASASSIQHTRSVIQNMPGGNRLNADDMRILAVPKDIDAIMAVGFGMSGAALITEASHDRLKLLPPMLSRELTILAVGPEAPLLILATRETCRKKHAKLIQGIKQMTETLVGKQQIRMLGLENFQEITEDDMKLLTVTKFPARPQEEKCD